MKCGPEWKVVVAAVVSPSLGLCRVEWNQAVFYLVYSLCRSLSSFHRAWHCSTECPTPTRRATKTQLGRSFGLLLSSTRRQSASPSQASQSACGLSGGGGGCLRLRAGGGFGGGEGEGASSELLEGGGGGGRTRGRDGAESQEEVGEGKLMEYVGGGGSCWKCWRKVGSACPMWCKKRVWRFAMMSVACRRRL